MFFYIDESGNTGSDLFNEEQPYLFYGLLSSKTNLDLLAVSEVSHIKQKYGIKYFHGRELSNNKITSLAPDLAKLQNKYKLRFDISSVTKKDLAIISFFDQVFDQGINPAFTWTGYWTPLRYIMLIKVAHLFDLPTLKQAWEARICLDHSKSKKIFVKVCNSLLSRLNKIPDSRSRELIKDTLSWAEANYDELGYHCSDVLMIKQISPNLIGLQSILYEVGEYIKSSHNSPVQIKIDNHQEFDLSKENLADYYAKLRLLNVIEETPLGVSDFTNMPLEKLSFSSYKTSIGIEIVDLILWIYQRYLQKKELPKAALNLLKKFAFKSKYHDISISGSESRAKSWIESFSKQDANKIDEAKKIIAIDEKRRRKSIEKGK
ncbi:hypothetical protein FOLKNPGA_03650 (plasmid) [Legionella sp. PC1000]|uniref:DUF3800 domain-containing protein n=1 Tax=Legionella sp. PC1000 TaxID=2746060 RepID=UPI0015F8BED5|nr:DUF3800 domain-containing protein [Legionella sp. PC1000]QLZ70831.1 hypothetical protein FOLKNPGA_03650 [Legionella sp. PC1000]